MSSARITISIPFVSGIPYFKKAVESVFAQTNGDWEAVVCDNSLDLAQRDEAKRIVDAYGDARFSFSSAPGHLPMCANFNRAIDIAKTDLVTILHSDDELLPEYVERMLAACQAHSDATLVFCNAKIIGPQGAEVFSFADAVKPLLTPRGLGHLHLSGEPALQALMRGNFIMAPTVCFRKSKLGDIRWSESLRMTADLDLYARILLSGRTIVGLSGPPAYAYRRHAQSSTAINNENLYRFEEEALTFDTIAERADAAKWPSAARVARTKTIIRLHLLYAILMDSLGRRWKAVYLKWKCLLALNR